MKCNYRVTEKVCGNVKPFIERNSKFLILFKILAYKGMLENQMIPIFS